MFTVVNHSASVAVGVDASLSAVTDAEFSIRNNHFIFSEPYRLLGIHARGLTMTRARLNIPHVNAYGRHHIYPFHRSATIPAESQWADYRDQKIMLPINEELIVEITNTGTDVNDVALWLGTPDWNANEAVGEQRLTLRFTCTITPVVSAWVQATAFAFDVAPRGGWYTIIGAQIQCVGGGYARFIFPRAPFYSVSGGGMTGRRLRPGIICTEAAGNAPPRWQMGALEPSLGNFGVFHTFEPPGVEFCGTTAGTVTAEGRMDVIYMGQNPQY